jgi:hypothetical protein
MRQLFDVMFVMTLVLPPAVVLAGAVALAWPRRARKTRAPVAHAAHA